MSVHIRHPRMVIIEPTTETLCRAVGGSISWEHMEAAFSNKHEGSVNHVRSLVICLPCYRAFINQLK